MFLRSCSQRPSACPEKVSPSKTPLSWGWTGETGNVLSSVRPSRFRGNAPPGIRIVVESHFLKVSLFSCHPDRFLFSFRQVLLAASSHGVLGHGSVHWGPRLGPGVVPHARRRPLQAVRSCGVPRGDGRPAPRDPHLLWTWTGSAVGLWRAGVQLQVRRRRSRRKDGGGWRPPSVAQERWKSGNKISIFTDKDLISGLSQRFVLTNRSFSRPDSPPALVYGLAQDKGFIWGLKWCPSGAWEPPSSNRKVLISQCRRPNLTCKKPKAFDESPASGFCPAPAGSAGGGVFQWSGQHLQPPPPWHFARQQPSDLQRWDVALTLRFKPHQECLQAYIEGFYSGKQRPLRLSGRKWSVMVKRRCRTACVLHAVCHQGAVLVLNCSRSSFWLHLIWFFYWQNSKLHHIFSIWNIQIKKYKAV